MAYLYYVEKRIHDIGRGRTVPEATFTPEDETYDDICYTFAETQLNLDLDVNFEWKFEEQRSFNGLYVVGFYSTDDNPLKIRYNSNTHYKKQFYVYIDFNKTESLSKVAVSWY